MKRILLYIAAFIPALALAQENPQTFTIKSNITHVTTPAKAYLIYQLGANNVIDSADVKNGSFEFTGTVINPTNAVLVIDHTGIGFSKLDKSADALNFYVEKADITITGTDSVAKAQIAGSPINDDNRRLTAQLNLLNDKVKKIYAEAQGATPAQQKSAEFQNTMQTRFKALQTEQENTLKTFVQDNPKSYLSLLALSSLGGPSADPRPLELLFNRLDASIKNTEAGKQLIKSLNDLKMTAIGSMAPDFTQPDVTGKPVSLSSLRGKYVLIDFWASWCGPCRQENPNVVKAYNQYKAKNFTIIGVSLDRPNGKADWQAAIKNDGLVWTQVSDLKFWQNEAAALYFVRAIPQNYLIDPQGKIIAKNLRGEDLQKKLSEIL